MRWKLVIVVPLIAAIVAYGLWEISIAAVFGGVRSIQLQNRLLLASAIIPLGLAALAAVFVYRHTARKRRTQAVISAFLALLLFGAAYFTGSLFFPGRLRFANLRPSSLQIALYAEADCSSLSPNPISFCTGFNESITN